MKKNTWLFVGIFCLSFYSTTAAFGEEDPHVIKEIPPNGIVINAPGTYVFKKDLTWDPNSDGIAITIEANNVTLDMQGYTLKSSSSVFKTLGIAAIFCENLQIMDGKLKNMGLSGVQCTFCSNLSIKDVEVDGLYVHDTATFIVPTGILTSECFNVSIDKCTVKNIRVQTASTAGIQLTATLSSKVTNCKIKNLLNKDGACTGIGHLLCADALVHSCHLDEIKSTFINNLNTEGHTAIGIIPVFTTGITIKKCKVTNVTGCCDDAHGISVFLCDTAVVEKCKVANVLDGEGEAQKGAKATGIEIYANNVNVNHCSVKNISAINPEDKQATGFSVALSNTVSFLKCKAKNVQVFDAKGKQNAALGYGTGFGWAPDPRPSLLMPAVNVLYQDCTAKNCQVGFDSWFHIDSFWDHVVAIGNDIAILNQGNEAQRTLSCDPCSECGCTQIGCFPTPYTVTVNNIAANNTFIAFGEGEVLLNGQ